MNTRISPDLEPFVRSLILNGRYASEDDVVADALRQLRNRQFSQFPTAPQAQPSMTEREFQRQLLEAGILDHAPAGYTADEPYEDFEPVAIAGEPLSETIMRERR